MNEQSWTKLIPQKTEPQNQTPILYAVSALSTSLLDGSPEGSGAFLATSYLNISGKSISRITFLPIAIMWDFGISNL